MGPLFPISYITAGYNLVFEPTMKRPQKPNFEHNFLAKEQERRGNNSTNLSLLLSGFPKKKMLEKLLILAFSSPLRIVFSLSGVHSANVTNCHFIIVVSWGVSLSLEHYHNNFINIIYFSLAKHMLVWTYFIELHHSSWCVEYIWLLFSS